MQMLVLSVRRSEFDGKFYLQHVSGQRCPVSWLGNGFDTKEQAEQRMRDILSGNYKDGGKRVAVGFDPIGEVS